MIRSTTLKASGLVKLTNAQLNALTPEVQLRYLTLVSRYIELKKMLEAREETIELYESYAKTKTMGAIIADANKIRIEVQQVANQILAIKQTVLNY